MWSMILLMSRLPGCHPCLRAGDRKSSAANSRRLFSGTKTSFTIVLYTSPHPGLLRLHFFYHHRPRRAKSWISPRLTGAMVPPKFHLRTLLHARTSFRQLPCGSRSGVGTIVQRNEDFVHYTAGTSLSGRRLLL